MSRMKLGVVSATAALCVVCSFGHGGKELQAAALAGRLEPVRVAEVALIDGEVVITGDWMPYGGVANHCAEDICWDAFEQDGTGFPIGGEPAGCGPSCRWYFGPNYCSGGAISDMGNVACNGGMSEEVEFAWYWTAGGAGTSEECMIVVFTAEDDWTEGAGCLTGLSAVYPGVAYDFGPLPSGGYYYSNPTLCGTGLGHQLPTDGYGLSILLLLRAHVADIPASCGQFMLWATGEDEIPPDGRVGTQHSLQYDDDFPKDGTFHLVDECYDYTFGFHPDPLCAMHMFYGEGRAGCEPCDANCDGSINAFDIQAFVSMGGPAPTRCSECAGDTNGDGSINGFDIQPFIECLSP